MSVEGLLEGRVAIITGAASGVGRAAAIRFARHGAKLVCADVNEDGLAALEKELSGIVTARCNVAVEAEVEALVALAAERFGRVDIIYNNVGITVALAADGKPVTLANSTDADFDKLMSVNVNGVIHGCRQAIRQFEKQGGEPGVIVNTASVSGLVGWGNVVYGATKGAVVALTRTLAIELAPQGIRVNSVCPAAMMTNFGSAAGANPSPALVEAYGKSHPLGRPIDPGECADAALFLASSLSANITGVNLPVDGGLTAG